MKVLWLSNKVQSGQDQKSTGTWLDSMGMALAHSGQVELGNISFGATSHTERKDAGEIIQWIIPVESQFHLRNGLPSANTVTDICQAVEEFKPDLVHVWGTETFWGLLPARGLIQRPALLGMQGVKSAIAHVYHGGLTLQEQIACIGPKEILRGSTIFQGRRRFAAWGYFEHEIIAGHRFITVQSLWQEAQVRAVNGDCRVMHNDFALREPFYVAEPWQPTDRPVIFFSASYPSPFKGIHVAVRALALLKRRFPAVELRIAGPLQRHGLRQEGYIAWINREARRLGVEANLKWLGSLTADQIVAELQSCAVVFLPTLIESYGMALAEAMAVGAPVAVAYAGGTAHLAKDEESALFFSPGDVEMAAYQAERLLVDRTLAKQLGRQARTVSLTRSDLAQIIERQIAIYCAVLEPATLEAA